MATLHLCFAARAAESRRRGRRFFWVNPRTGRRDNVRVRLPGCAVIGLCVEVVACGRTELPPRDAPVGFAGQGGGGSTGTAGRGGSGAPDASAGSGGNSGADAGGGTGGTGNGGTGGVRLDCRHGGTSVTLTG